MELPPSLRKILEKPLVSTGRPVERIQERFDPPPLAPGVHPAPELHGAPLDPKARAPRHFLSRRSDSIYLNLGAVYEIVKVPTDILTQYKLEIGIDIPVETFEFSRPVLGRLKHWGGLVQAIPKELDEPFSFWLCNQLFVDRPARQWWRPRRTRVKVYDPAKVDAGGVLGPDDVVELQVWLPFGSRGGSYLATQVVPPEVVFVIGDTPPADTVPPGDLFDGQGKVK